MRPIQPQQRRSAAGFWLGLVLIVLVGGSGIVGVMTMMGIGPWTSTAEDSFVVRIPINARPIPAYQKVQREDLINPATGAFEFQEVRPKSAIGMSITGISTDNTPVDGHVEDVKNLDGAVVFVVAGRDVPQSNTMELGGALMSTRDIIGRVLRDDKRIGRGFRESSFFPQGTPEGIAGATPPGMKAITLDATKLTGIHGLNSGNRLDLIASMPVGDTPSQTAPAGLITSKQSSKKNSATEPQLLARNALLLRPVTIRNETSTAASLTQGKRQVNEPKYEVAIAIMPDDLIQLQNALDKGLKITCVAASMQPETKEAAQQRMEEKNQLTAPVTVRSIPAYEVITREAFISPATRKIRMEPVTEQQVQQFQLATRLQDMLGSIARHDIPAGSFVGRSDLLESQRQQRARQSATDAVGQGDSGELMQRHHTTALPAPQPPHEQAGANIVGDRPTVTSFIPPGRTAIAVPWNRIFGSEHLQIDDHFDLLASYSLERRRTVNQTNSGGSDVIKKEYEEYTSRGTDRTRDESLADRGEPWFIATDAIVIGPVGFPPPNAALRAISGQQQENAKNRLSGPAILLAVDTRDVESIATVLNTPDALLSVAFRAKEGLQGVPEGFRHIAVAPVAIPAYSELSDLRWKGLRRDITGRLVRADDPRFADAITVDQINLYYGRVLRTAKTRFAAFFPSDFMPEGAEPGVAAAIGPDRVLVNVSADQVQALNRFRDNDEVAIILTGDVTLPQGAVLHSTMTLGAGSEVIAQSARIVRGVSDVSDTIALTIPRESAAQFTSALAAASSAGSKRLVAVARHRVNAPAINAEPAPQPLSDHHPLNSASKIYEITGGQSRTHFFVNGAKE